MKTVKIIVKTLILAMIYGVVAHFASKLMNVKYYDVIASFALGLACYLLTLVNYKNRIKE